MKTPKQPRSLSKKHSVLRTVLGQFARSIRRHDFAGSSPVYNRNRTIEEIPYSDKLHSALERRIAKGKSVHVLEKGAGEGHIIAHLKNMDKDRVHTTAISLSHDYAQENEAHIDEKIQGIGIRQKHEKKFDIIYDAYGEDYYLPKELVPYSLKKTISDLKKGGEAFLILPLYPDPDPHLWLIEEGRALAQRLKKRRDIHTTTTEIEQKWNEHNWVDLVLHIKKR